jgi:putative protein-disulfide isomerase
MKIDFSIFETQPAGSEQQAAQQPAVELVYFTDPLCCWSWAMSPQLEKLKEDYGRKIAWRYCMAGLIPDWKSYRDPLNSVFTPTQMGPVWAHAGEMTGMPIKAELWVEDPPSSSFPACMAVKCAALQSPEAEEQYLLLCRTAAMVQGKNVSKEEELEKIAQELALQLTSFDAGKFMQDYRSNAGLPAFRSNLQEIKTYGIKRFPAMLLNDPGGKDILITGYRPYSLLLEALKQLSIFKKTA